MQFEERQNGVKGGDTLSKVRTIKEAFESIKSNYLHLLSDRDHAIKFAEETYDAYQKKENEVDRLCLDLSLAHHSLCKGENQTLIVATLEGPEVDTRIMEIKQIVEGINELHNDETLLNFKEIHEDDGNWKVNQECELLSWEENLP